MSDSPFDHCRIPAQRQPPGYPPPARLIVACNVADLMALARDKDGRTSDPEMHRRHCQIYWTVYYHLMRKAD